MSVSKLFLLTTKTNSISKRSFFTSLKALTKLELSKRNVLADERVSIRILDVEPSFSYLTIRTRLVNNEQKLFFESVNGFKMGKSQILDLDESIPSEGYSIPDSMGIFWSMTKIEGKDSHHKLMPSDVTKPLSYDITVEDSNGKVLCSESMSRHYMSSGVKRIKLNTGRIRGTLFVPASKPGDKFPAIINIYGGIHNKNVIEEDSSMLASRGIVALSLAYFGVEDLPKSYTNKTLEAEYFEEAMDYLLARDDVLKHKGIGLIGSSKGGDIVQSLACLRPDVVGAICIQNGASVSILTSLAKNGVSMGDIAQLDYEKVKLRSDDSIDISEVVSVPEPDSKLNIPIEKFPGNVLWIAGEDDTNFLSVDFATTAEKRAKRYGKNNFELILYPGMGHFVPLPFTPLTKYALHPLVPKGLLVHYGGEPMLQAKGQEQAWHKKIKFFKESLI